MSQGLPWYAWDWFNKEPREKLSQILSNVSLLKKKTNTYSVSEQKNKNRYGLSKQFGPKLQRKKL